MKTLKKLGIWMDHSNANLIEFSDEVKPTRTISADFDNRDMEETLQRSENEMHNKQQHKQGSYYKDLAAEIRNFNEVLLFGPTSAKAELLNFLRKDHRFADIKIELHNADKMTDKQQHAFVRDHFKRFEIKTL
ncbi:MAG: hypothetical protein CFE23_08195 [Flavobacterium sp. BFFFF1]|uniref:hypothetical protein n=1 Tax=Flavobacterium sp. BFFFF1 TaxID=2015557 RepID=UPI000BC3EDB0|nr:hypothetical protein [Flavobacterium sp. BFFFF1]OYU80692.1 MAG: hypothetical protein CFE23_08195 [Flavobacterium sp. BFFFF1]